MIKLSRVAGAIALAAVTSLSAGCGGAGGVDEATRNPPTGAGDVVVRLAGLGGLVPFGYTEGQPPAFSLYGDGRLISAPAGRFQTWPELSEHRVDPDTVRRLFRAAITAAEPPRSPDPQVPDGGQLNITIGGATPRTAGISGVADRATALYAAFTAAAGAGGTPYRPTAVAAVAVPSNNNPTDQRGWPLGTLPGQPVHGGGIGCTLLRGGDIGRARQAAAGVTGATTWSSAGQRWSVFFRPLLPDEAGCAAL
ncbi:MAG: hypothetical protein V7637_2216 [Mycobacteriales bacterium]|jgi:hypothetical protein